MTRRLTELEGVCLALIDKYDRCTAYRVRRELQQAPSSHWRGSAGSVYPMLSRLEVDGFLKSDSDSDDGRGRKTLHVTKAGKAAVNAWIMAGSEIDVISSVTDPLRSRSFFLGVLSDKQRAQYLDASINQLEKYLSETKAHLKDRSAEVDQFEYFGSLGAVKVTQARLEWLKSVRKQLKQ